MAVGFFYQQYLHTVPGKKKINRFLIKCSQANQDTPDFYQAAVFNVQILRKVNSNSKKYNL